MNHEEIRELLEINFLITRRVLELLDESYPKIKKMNEDGGTFELSDLVHDLTIKFYDQFKDHEWDGDYLDTVDKFIIENT